jgi:hypothetical protein
MESVLSAIIAIIGTLLGSATTYAFQRASSDRTERIARIERFRQERLAVYTEFAGAITDLRRAAYDRWHRYQESPEGAEFAIARDEYYRIYSSTKNIQIKLRLLTDDVELAELAHHAVERATEIKDADAEQDRAVRGERAKLALDAFVTRASARLR